MSFESLQFAVFLVSVFAIYWVFPAKQRWIILLAANFVFYAFSGIRFLAVILYVCVVTYFFSRIHANNKRWILALGIIADILPLLIFKYLGFFQSNVDHILRFVGYKSNIKPLSILLPLGISFYTFSAVAYLVDSYKGKVQEEYSFLQLITGISFFPCLIAGPIERQQKIVPQIIKEQSFDYDTATYGLKRIAVGYFKKMVIADTLAMPVDKIFSSVHDYHGLQLFAAIILFTIEIYCDFSGYSDISIGVSRLFGIKLDENFLSPFFSKSFTEVWKRWHISLSSWFRDYVYIPLGGSRKGNTRKAINTMIVFLVSGFWHGAAWTYIIWGGLNGVAQIIEGLITNRKRNNDNKFFSALSIIIVFVFFCVFATFFRANTVGDALYILTHMFQGFIHPVTYTSGILEALGISAAKFIIIVCEILLLGWYDYTLLKRDPINVVSSKPLVIRWAIYVAFVLLIVQLSSKGAAVEFIYAAF